MMLNRVDLPQPDGPITARNSPGATSNEMWSTAVMGPSGGSKVFPKALTTRSGGGGERGAVGPGHDAFGRLEVLHDVVDDEQRRGRGGARDLIEARHARPQPFLSAFDPAAGLAGV